MRTGEKLNKTEWVRVLFGAVLCPTNNLSRPQWTRTLIGACVPRLTTVLNLTKPPLRYRVFPPLFCIHRHRESRVNISKIIRMLRS